MPDILGQFPFFPIWLFHCDLIYFWPPPVSQLVTLASAQLLLQSRVKTSAWIGAVQLGKISEAASRQIAMYCNRLQEIATHTSSEQEFLNKDCSMTLSLKAGDAIHAGSNRQQPVGICLDMGQNFKIPQLVRWTSRSSLFRFSALIQDARVLIRSYLSISVFVSTWSCNIFGTCARIATSTPLLQQACGRPSYSFGRVDTIYQVQDSSNNRDKTSETVRHLRLPCLPKDCGTWSWSSWACPCSATAADHRRSRRFSLNLDGLNADRIEHLAVSKLGMSSIPVYLPYNNTGSGPTMKKPCFEMVSSTPLQPEQEWVGFYKGKEMGLRKTIFLSCYRFCQSVWDHYSWGLLCLHTLLKWDYSVVNLVRRMDHTHTHSTYKECAVLQGRARIWVLAYKQVQDVVNDLCI